jgi:hypothetical protein
MRTRNNFWGLVLLSALVFGFVSCNESPVAPPNDLALKSATISAPTVFPDLVSGEETGILQMREEEKMAHDVYVDFYARWNLPVFENISIAETSHYNAVYTLITAYGLTDPSTGVVGTFTNPAIGELYAKLIAAGTVSAAEALKTGAYIEEYDILDLEKLIAATENPAILQIYSNLLRGSRNHLRSFVATLANENVVYVPQLMDQETFDAIINSPMESGNQNGLQNGNGNKNGQNNGKGKGKGNSGSGSGKGSSGNGNGANKGAGNGTGTGVCANG